MECTERILLQEFWVTVDMGVEGKPTCRTSSEGRPERCSMASAESSPILDETSNATQWMGLVLFPLKKDRALRQKGTMLRYTTRWTVQIDQI